MIVAVSRGHTKVAALLREHGAEEEGQYMGLEAADLQEGEGEGDGAVEEEAGRKKTQRPLLAGDPGYDDVYSPRSTYLRATDSTIASRLSGE